MSEDTLFDPGPPDPGHFVDEPKLSYERRLTIWRNDMIAAGVHPITGARLLDQDDPVTKTCGNCANHGRQGGVAGTYHKCRLNNTGGPKTDLRVGWPACEKWEPEG